MDPVCSPLHNSHVSPFVPAMCSQTDTTLQFSTNNEVNERVCKHSGVKEKLEQSRSVNSSKLQYRSHVQLHSERHVGKSRPPNDQVYFPCAIKDLEHCIHTLSEVKEIFIKICEQVNVHSINESTFDVSVNTTLSQSRARPFCGPDIVHQLATLKGCSQKLRRETSGIIYMDNVEELECAGEVVEINVYTKLDTPQADVRVLDSPTQYNVNETKRVILTPRTTLINFDIGSVEGVRADMITDHEVLQAAENILLAKIDWNRDNTIRSLKAEKRKLDREMKIIENKKKLVEEELIKERKRKAEEIEHIQTASALKMKEEQAKVERFVLHLEGRDEILTDILDQLKAGRLTDVVKGLLLDFDVRLLGVDCGLNFLLEGPITLSDGSMLRQLQQVLEELLPEEKRREMKWENRIWDNAQGDDLEIGQVSPVSMQVAEDENNTEDVDLSKDRNWKPSQFDETQLGYVGYLQKILTKISSNLRPRVHLIDQRTSNDKKVQGLIDTICNDAAENVLIRLQGQQ